LGSAAIGRKCNPVRYYQSRFARDIDGQESRVILSGVGVAGYHRTNENDACPRFVEHLPRSDDHKQRHRAVEARVGRNGSFRAARRSAGVPRHGKDMGYACPATWRRSWPRMPRPRCAGAWPPIAICQSGLCSPFYPMGTDGWCGRLPLHLRCRPSKCGGLLGLTEL